MDCGYCGHKIPPGAMDCPRCGGPAVASGPFRVGGTGPQPPLPPAAPGGGGEIFTSAPAQVDLYAPGHRPAADPEAGLHTQLVSSDDRQEGIETRIVEPPPPPREVPVESPKGLPDSRVARGVEDSVLEVKRFILRLGRFGRLSLFSHAAVIVGAVSPWFYVPHQGYTPGIEAWGWVPALASLAAVGTLLWRHRRTPRARVLPVVLHLALSVGLVLSLLWVYQTTIEMPDHLEPRFAFGIYLSAVGALGASLGAIVGLKDVR